MRRLSSVATIHRAVAAGFLALTLVDFFFAGLAAFDQTTSHAHADLGTALMAVAALLAVLAVVDRPEAREASIALTFAMLVEVLLGVFADDVAALAGLHGLVALVVVYAAYQALRGAPLWPR